MYQNIAPLLEKVVPLIIQLFFNPIMRFYAPRQVENYMRWPAYPSRKREQKENKKRTKNEKQTKRKTKIKKKRKRKNIF